MKWKQKQEVLAQFDHIAGLLDRLIRRPQFPGPKRKFTLLTMPSTCKPKM